jgi:excisionase family DNA binding protein
MAPRVREGGEVSEQTLEEKLLDVIRQAIRNEVRRAVDEATRVDEFLTTKAAAELAKVAPATIRRWLRSKALTKHTAGRVIRISRLELEKFLRNNGRAANDADEMSPEDLAAKMIG